MYTLTQGNWRQIELEEQHPVKDRPKQDMWEIRKLMKKVIIGK